MPSSNRETQGMFCDGLASNIVVQYSVGPIITLHSRITAREYVDNDAVSQDDSVPIPISGTVQSWFEELEGELQHLSWPPQSRDFNIAQPLWSVLELE
jgi:hypothetical protein